MASSQETRRSSPRTSIAGNTSRALPSNKVNRLPTFDAKSTNRKQQARMQKITSEKKEPDSPLTSLSVDLLSKCLGKLESVLQVVSCATVSREWREAASLDVMWKELFLQWHSRETNVSPQHAALPSGCANWREAFIRYFTEGRTIILERTIANALEADFLRFRDPNVLDYTPGVSFQELARELELTFYLRVNNSPQFKLRGKQATVFTATCILHCPFKHIKRRLKLSALTSVEVIVSSDRLSQYHSVARFITGKASKWRTDGSSEATLRLLRHGAVGPSAASLIVGTLPESVNPVDESSFANEEVLFLKAGLHLGEVISEFFKRCKTVVHRIRRDPDPTYGLHGYHVSIQLHNFDKMVWTREFQPVVWDPAESSASETAVFRLISSFEVVPAKPSLSWRSEAFSGEVENTLLWALTLWDIRGETVWQSMEVAQLRPVSLATVEYGLPEFEGLQLEACTADMSKGITVSMRCSIPVSNPEALFAVTDLRMSLEKKFLQQWFGVSNI